MRFRTVAIAAALTAGFIQTGQAFAPHKGAERPVVTAGRAPRAHRDITWHKQPVASLAGWGGIVDRDTDVPFRVWGPSLATPGATADAATAEATARQFLAAHLAELAPGAALGDLVLLANVLDPSSTIRTVTFAQRAQGLTVVGGAIGLTFERDHLVMVSSSALPNVHVRMPGGTLPLATLRDAAVSWLGNAGVAAEVKRHGERVILPIVHPRTAAGPDIEYRVVETLTVENTREAGRWDVWLDAADAAPVARHSTLMFATGTVLYDAPDRYPGSTRTPKPAPYANHTINGATVTSLLDGTVTWSGADPGTITPGLSGTFVAITNKAGAVINETLSIAGAGQLVWSKAADEYGDAQLSSYIFANTAKRFVKTRLNPNLAWLDQTLSVNVNEQQTCNAYSTGDDVHFFKKNTQCENTGRIADVVYHEFGHSVHYNSIIPGEGQFDGSLSEGMADTMAASITGDHGMGRGFFFTDAPLRDLVGSKRWPDDADGEVHDEGEIIGESLWDLRTALQTKLGTDAGYAQFLKVYYSVVQRASDIPSSYAAAIVGDDDDGNLANGTPNQCEINAAFGPHGLADPASTLGLAPPTRDNYTVSMTASPATNTACPGPSITGITVNWTPKGGTGGTVNLTASGNSWSGDIPHQPDGTVINYTVAVTLSDGSSITYPQNKADAEYQMYVGPVTKLWCADFETGAADWTHGGTADEWEAGKPLGIGGDPKAAHGGDNVFGIDLGSDDGLYSSSANEWAQSPMIDLKGQTNVRLQYYRWLNVEDAAYDHATVYANGTAVWSNFASQGMPTTTEVNHTDKEWRFADVDLSAQAATGSMQLKFELTSDRGLELGGWTIDDVCIVAVGGPSGTCGNGTVDTGEQCDDGNTTDGDGCSASCQDETKKGDSGGCCDTGGNPMGAGALSLLTLGLVIRRRRRGARR